MLRRRIVLGIMLLVSAWSIWAFAQGRPRPRPAPPPPPVGVRPHHARPAPPEHAQEARDAEEAAEAPQSLNWTDFGRTDSEGKPWPPFVAMIVNFGILAAGYYLLGRKPVAAALQERRDSIRREIDEAQKMREEAEKRAQTYQAKLASLEEEVKMAREALVRAGEAERDRIVTDAEAKAERMRKDAEFMVEQELKQLRQDLWHDTVEAAVGAAEELLKRRVTPADQERLAEDYLADLGGKKPPKPVAGTGQQESAT